MEGREAARLRRKPFAILRYLVANPRRLVTHDELLAHVWSGAVVSESAVRTPPARAAAGARRGRDRDGDRPRLPVRRRARGDAPSAAARRRRPPRRRASSSSAATPSSRSLRAALERARGGHRQMCFVTGEPGIGKTTLVDTFLAELDHRPDVIIGARPLHRAARHARGVPRDHRDAQRRYARRCTARR